MKNPNQKPNTSDSKSASQPTIASLLMCCSVPNPIAPEEPTDSPSSLPTPQNFPRSSVSDSSESSASLSLTSASYQSASEVCLRTPSSTSSNVGNNNTVAEFLFQLTKMLTDDNSEVIEWTDGKIEVHIPHKLASDVLHKYFRHSKYASFQRQLNYFGFRKLSGKGKMAPCSYINDAATDNLQSILNIKRKTSTLTKEKKSDVGENIAEHAFTVYDMSMVPPARDTIGAVPTCSPKTNRSFRSKLYTQGLKDCLRINPAVTGAVGKGAKHHMNKYLKAPNPLKPAPVDDKDGCCQTADVPGPFDHVALAQSAVGKGVCHQFLPSSASSTVTLATSVAKCGRDAMESQRAANRLVSSFTLLDPTQYGIDLSNIFTESPHHYQETLFKANTDQEQLKEMDDRSRLHAAHTLLASFTDVNNNQGEKTNPTGNLKHSASLVELAMLPPVEAVDPTPWSEMAFSVDDFSSQDFEFEK